MKSTDRRSREHLTAEEREVIRTFRRRWRWVQASLYAAVIAFLCVFLFPYVFGVPRSNVVIIAGISVVVILYLNAGVMLAVKYRCPACRSTPGSGRSGLPTLGLSTQVCERCGARLDWPRTPDSRFSTPQSVAREWQRRSRLLQLIFRTTFAIAVTFVLSVYFLRPKQNDEVFVAAFIAVLVMLATCILSFFGLYRCPSCGDWPRGGRDTLDGVSFNLYLNSCKRCGVSFTGLPPMS